ncbi:hypothetical protein [Streptomyces murinus]|uniref:hypothetical protein n=1 Tax=Streptomyces murinus TaxID=33900 RepID=UPI003813A551
MGKLLEQLAQAGSGHLRIEFGLGVVTGSTEYGCHGGRADPLGEHADERLYDARAAAGVSEQEMGQLVADDLGTMPLARCRDMKYVILGVKSEHNPAWGVNPTGFRQFMEVQRAASLSRQLPTDFVHRIGIGNFDSLKLLLALLPQLRFSSHRAPIKHERDPCCNPTQARTPSSELNGTFASA